ncbi:hypothetical protein DM01DRAFT_1391890 [Hesseltinella vesiculosa]|uniref:Cupredoxin n=1 Tax=Hesseltinella vesiculosa TaxID=101127 RepID=A0A1X2GEL6_9FUNG|nr:hypothetical protein DM01DRAFT_1391890 [Hesseltinella vesiculosa]
MMTMLTKCCVTAWLFLLVQPALAELREFDWTVTQGPFNPDCAADATNALYINNQFPGPTMVVNQDDDVVVHIHNLADVPTGVHFHGIRQYGTPEADGVPGVTQSMIMPGEIHTQRFRVSNQAGTFFYHAHVGNQDDTVQGALIVNEKDMPYDYEGEFTVHISEWWHQPYNERQQYYLGPSYTFDPSSDSILLNGHTVHNASLPHTHDCPGYTTFDVQPNTLYRMRLIGGNTFRTFGFAIKDHDFEIIEVDGELIEPHLIDHLELTPGQRFSALIRTGDHAPGSVFPMATSYRYRNQAEGLTENGFGYLRYGEPGGPLVQETTIHRDGNEKKNRNCQKKKKKVIPDRAAQPADAATDPIVSPDQPAESSPIIHPVDVVQPQPDDHQGGGGRGEGGGRGGEGGGRGGEGGGRGGGGGGGNDRPKVEHTGFPEIPKPVGRDWVWQELRPLAARDPILDEKPSRTLKIRAWGEKQPDNTTRFTMSGRLTPPLLTRIKENVLQGRSTDPVEVDGYEGTFGTYPLDLYETVDLVFQNVKSGRYCLLHPWHTHGHSHYTIATGDGEYEHDLHKDLVTYPHPIYKDVSTVYPTDINETTQGCGWTKVRLHADNPGVWSVHCHITAHMMQGKLIVLQEAADKIDEFKLYQ